MIVTVTLNPSLDRAIEVGRLVRGEVIRAAATRLDPGGKGVNVSRALLANGVASLAVMPVGGVEGVQLVRLLEAEGVDVRSVPIAGLTRSNVTLAEPDGTVVLLDPAESRDLPQTHQATGPNQPLSHHGDEGGAAGDGPGVLAEFPKDGQSLVERTGRAILERVHDLTRCAAAWIDSTIL